MEDIREISSGGKNMIEHLKDTLKEEFDKYNTIEETAVLYSEFIRDISILMKDKMHDLEKEIMARSAPF